MDRKFDRRSIKHGDKMIGAQVIACGVDGCSAEFVLPDTGRSALPPDMVSSKARRGGWKVGRGPSRDRCPEHAGRHRNEGERDDMPSIAETASRGLPERTRQVLDTHTVDKGGVVTLRAAPGLESDSIAPRIMDREEKRILFGELDAAYQDAEHGYKLGNSDKTIAASLGVPVLWVRQLRDEMFGPADGDKAGKKIIELSERLGKLDAKIIDATDAVRCLMTEAQAMRLELNTLQRKE